MKLFSSPSPFPSLTQTKRCPIVFTALELVIILKDGAMLLDGQGLLFP
ncbi:MAG: hypothetical protein ACUVV5_02070 [Candidatus Aminicenantales bacterium]